MPYMHSGSALEYTQTAALAAQPGLEDTLRFDQRHQAIIERFSTATSTEMPSWAANQRPRTCLFLVRWGWGISKLKMMTYSFQKNTA